MQIVESLQMVTEVEDWSRVRSPSRADRRRKQGHRQNIVVRLEPRKDAITLDGGKTFCVHPEAARALRHVIKQSAPRPWDNPLDALIGRHHT